MFAFNTEVFNLKKLPKIFPQKGASFNGLDFTSFDCLNPNSNGIMIQKLNIYDLNNIEISQANSISSDGGTIFHKKYNSKSISFTLFFQAKDHNDLIHMLDNFKEKTSKINGNLDIMVTGKTRRHVATLSSLTVPSFTKSDDHVEGVEVEFISTSPHWSFLDFEQENSLGVTENFTQNVFNSGSYHAFPIIYIITQDAANISGFSIFSKKAGDPGLGYEIKIKNNIVPNSIIELNYNKKTVKINNEDIPFFGVMTPLSVGENSLYFSFDGSISANVYTLYQPTFL